jgi:hypothetical protein
MNRLLWSFCFMLIFTIDLRSQDATSRRAFNGLRGDVLSCISGSRALYEITDLKRWQELLHVNSTNLEELKKLKNGSQIAEKVQLIAKSKGIEDPRELDGLRERLVAEAMAEILDPDQLALRRVHFLRELYNEPTSLFNSSATLLLELGMSEEQFKQMQAGARGKTKDIRDRVNGLFAKAIDSAAAYLSEAQASRLWQLFGRDFNSPPRSEVGWKEIQVLPNTNAKSQLAMARIIILADDMKLSPKQILSLIELENVELRNFERDRSLEISADLDRVLSKEQRAAIVQGMQRNLLLGDLLVVLSPEVVKYIGIEKDKLVSIQSLILDDAKTIQDFQFEKQMEVLKSELSIMPFDFQAKVMKLLEGVWE